MDNQKELIQIDEQIEATKLRLKRLRIERRLAVLAVREREHLDRAGQSQQRACP